MAQMLAYPPGVCYRRLMSSIPRQLATFAAVLAVLYTGGFVAGQFIDTGGHSGGDMEHEVHAAEAGEPAVAVRGLAVAEEGLRMVLETPELRRGRRSELRFTVAGS